MRTSSGGKKCSAAHPASSVDNVPHQAENVQRSTKEQAQPQQRCTETKYTSPLNSQPDEPHPPPLYILRHERDRIFRIDVAHVDLCAQEREVPPHFGDEDERLRAGLAEGVGFWCVGALGVVEVDRAGAPPSKNARRRLAPRLGSWRWS